MVDSMLQEDTGCNGVSLAQEEGFYEFSVRPCVAAYADVPSTSKTRRVTRGRIRMPTVAETAATRTESANPAPPFSPSYPLQVVPPPKQSRSYNQIKQEHSLSSTDPTHDRTVPDRCARRFLALVLFRT